MSKDDVIEMDGKVVDALPNAVFQVELANGWTVVTNDHSAASHYEHTMVIRRDGCPEILTLPDGGVRGGRT